MFQLPRFRRKDDPELWLFRYNKMADLNKWSVEIKLNYVDNCFNNKMQVWFMQQGFKNWKQFEDAFLFKYGKKVKLDKIFVEIINFKMNKSESIDAYIERFENKRLQFNRETLKQNTAVVEEEQQTKKKAKRRGQTSTSAEGEVETDELAVGTTTIPSIKENAGLSISENAFIKFFIKGLLSKGLKRYLKVEKPETLD